MIDARIGVTRGAFALDAQLHVEAGRTHALVGPNGAGKTTLLRAIMGLEPLSTGRIVLDGVVVDDPGHGRFVPTRRRRVGVVFQEPRLLPHLSARENVAFARTSGRSRRGDARVDELLDAVGVTERADAPPDELSGGEAQRVAIARALATEPNVLCLDEPFASIDRAGRTQTRRLLGQVLARFEGATVVVSHAPIDVLSLADEVTVLEAGHVRQRGSAESIRTRPRTRWAAEFAGVNLLAGDADGTVVRLASGAFAAIAEPASGPVTLVVHPHAVALHARAPSGSPRNAWRCSVQGLERDGARLRVELGGPVDLVAEITADAAVELGVHPGARLWATVKATEIDVTDA